MDQALEKAYNKPAKGQDGVIGFTSRKEAVDQFFLNCYLAVPQPTLGHSQGDSFTNPMLITTNQDFITKIIIYIEK